MLIVLLDTPCNRRRYRLNKIILGYGIRVQKSVFECQIDEAERQEMQRELNKILNPDEDTLRIQPCCQKDWQSIMVHGGSPPLKDEAYWHIDE